MRTVGATSQKFAAQQQFSWLKALSVMWGGRPCVSVFDPVYRVSPDANRVIRGLISESQRASKPPTDSIITAVVTVSLPPCRWGFVAGIENLLVSLARCLSGESVRVGLRCMDTGEGKQVSEWRKLLKDLIKSLQMRKRLSLQPSLIVRL